MFEKEWLKPAPPRGSLLTKKKKKEEKNTATSYMKSLLRKTKSGFSKCLKSVRKSVLKLFPERLDDCNHWIIDPQDKRLKIWNKLFVWSCIIAVYIDPFFLYLPIIQHSTCFTIDMKLAYYIARLRNMLDAFYVFHIIFQFRTSYTVSSSRVFGRGEFVRDPTQIAQRYCRRTFIIDVLSVLPIPEIGLWIYSYKDTDVVNWLTAFYFIIFFQYFPRLVRIFILIYEIKKSFGVFTKSALAGAGFYLVWYILACHFFGALWHLLALRRNFECWKKFCTHSEICNTSYLYCGYHHMKDPNTWRKFGKTLSREECSANADNTLFKFGIYREALISEVVSRKGFAFVVHYCFWWGLRNMSTLGQGLQLSPSKEELIFAESLAVAGLILFALLIGNMQSYFQTGNTRLEEMRTKKSDIEQWMHHRSFPDDIREDIRRYDQYKWLETRGVDEENLIQSLPQDLRRKIQRHTCLNLVKRVPLFANMDERLLDAICERLKPSFYTERTYIMREGEPVKVMLFIICGRLESETTNGGRNGFFNRGLLKEGDFCGEELLTWVLDPKTGSNLPTSTRTVKALKEVEAFALTAEELNYFGNQFRRLHSRWVQHTFRFHSQQWRTWAACFIQAAWRRCTKRKIAQEFHDERDEETDKSGYGGVHSSSLAVTFFASWFAQNALRSVHRLQNTKSATTLVRLQKPPEPDFSTLVIQSDFAHPTIR